jgi:hypothetical protein
METQKYANFLIAFGVHVAVNNRTVFSIAMEMQKLGPLCTVVVMLLTIISIKHYERVSIFLPQPEGKSQLFRTVLYSYLWPVWLYHIFPHYFINGTIFGKNVLNIKLCFDFLYSFCLKHFSF